MSTNEMPRVLDDVEITRVRFKPQRLNYSEIAQWIKEGKKVFLPISRKRLWRAKVAVKSKGVKAEVFRVDFDGELGYLFVKSSSSSNQV